MMYNRQVIEQKIDYIHNNPISKHCDLADNATNYKYSSASFYSNEDKTWSFFHIVEGI